MGTSQFTGFAGFYHFLPYHAFVPLLIFIFLSVLQTSWRGATNRDIYIKDLSKRKTDSKTLKSLVRKWINYEDSWIFFFSYENHSTNWLRCISITIKENGIHELWMSQQLVLSIQFEIFRFKRWRHIELWFFIFFDLFVSGQFTRNSPVGISLFTRMTGDQIPG